MGFLGESEKIYAILLLCAAQVFNGFNTIGASSVVNFTIDL